MFTTPEGRAVALQEIHDGGSVQLGSAMAHARTTKLGPWGDRDQLRRDCCILLIGELRAAGISPPALVHIDGHGRTQILRHAVKYTKAFSEAYAHARYQIELDSENSLRAALGHELIEGRPPQGEPVADDKLAEAVAEELRL